jgi:hypothetical protein
MSLWLPKSQTLILQFVISTISLLFGHPETSLNIPHIDVHLFGYAKLLFQQIINVVMKSQNSMQGYKGRGRVRRIFQWNMLSGQFMHYKGPC